jgi:hypothetical protein
MGNAVQLFPETESEILAVVPDFPFVVGQTKGSQVDQGPQLVVESDVWWWGLGELYSLAAH